MVAGRIVPIIVILLSSVVYHKTSFAEDVSSTPSCGANANTSDYVDQPWSTPEECLRICSEDEAPLYCYYHFTLEYYPTMNNACSICIPDNTNPLTNIGQCECIEADGFERTVLSVNRMLPGPSIQVCENDMVIIDVVNKVEGLGATLHWHGVFQNGYQYYDGVPFVTQCPIQSHNTFRYQFRAKNAGTHFWHSHVALHKIDGQYGSLIVRQSPTVDPQSSLYDEDLPTHVMLLSDWMHELASERFPGLLNRLQGQSPANVLINGKGTWMDPDSGNRTDSSVEIFDIEPGKRYRFRMINSFSTVCLTQLNIEDHRLTIIAQDGEDVEPVDVDTIVSGSGERVDFVLTADQPSNQSYWIQVRGLNECGTNEVQQFAILRYAESTSTLPPTDPPGYWNGLRLGTLYNPVDARCDKEYSICVNEFKSVGTDDPDILEVDADYQFMVPFKFYTYSDIVTFFEPGKYTRFLTTVAETQMTPLINGVIYDEPPQPLITDPRGNYINCDAFVNILEELNPPPECVHTFDVKKGSVVEIILYDQGLQPLLAHSFHLHGYAFRVFDIGRFRDNRNITVADMAPVLERHKQRLIAGNYSHVPGKDSVVVPQGGWVILRFKADNPGWWLFHCHFVWHTITGMKFVVHVGQQVDLPPVPPGFPRCGDFTPPVCPNE